MNRIARRFQALIAPAVMLAAWEAAADAGWLPDYLVAPSKIVVVFWGMIASGELWPHLSGSLVRAYGGFALGLFFGMTMGLLAGVSRAVGNFYDPLISLAYPVPKIAILPILMVWFGLGDVSKIAVIMTSVFFPVFINAYAGARAVNRIYIWSARSMGASSAAVFRRIVIPAAMPHILTGARNGLALSFIVLFASELVGAKAGLGYLIGVAEDSGRFDLMYVAIISIGLAGFISDRILIRVRRWLLAGQTLGRQEFGA